jgi:hypothetical protein
MAGLFLNFTSINTFESYCLILIRRVLTGLNELYVIVFDFISLLRCVGRFVWKGCLPTQLIFSVLVSETVQLQKGTDGQKRSTSSPKHLQQLRLFSGITKALQLRAHGPRQAVVAWGVVPTVVASTRFEHLANGQPSVRELEHLWNKDGNSTICAAQNGWRDL